MHIVAHHPTLKTLSSKDLVALLFISTLAISRLRWPTPHGDDLVALRVQLLRREIGR